MPEMLLQVLLNLSDLIVKCQRFELTASFSSRHIKTSVAQTLAQPGRQLTTKARKVVDKISHAFPSFENYLIMAMSPNATTTPITAEAPTAPHVPSLGLSQ
jgi:hypothetical protein